MRKDLTFPCLLLYCKDKSLRITMKGSLENMSENEKNSKTVSIHSEHDVSDIVKQPHGQQQQMKMEIVEMIHSAESPFDIIYHIARRLEKDSGEPGYAKYVEDQIRAIYGFALEHVKPMEDELHEVEARLKRIEAAYENPEFTEEEHIRIGFAVNHHKKNIERLKDMIRRAKADHDDLTLRKN